MSSVGRKINEIFEKHGIAGIPIGSLNFYPLLLAKIEALSKLIDEKEKVCQTVLHLEAPLHLQAVKLQDPKVTDGLLLTVIKENSLLLTEIKEKD